MKTVTRGVLFLGGLLLLGVIVRELYSQRELSSQTPTSGAQVVADEMQEIAKDAPGSIDEQALDQIDGSIPLQETVAERQQFTRELVAWKDQAHTYVLFQKWIDVIGANGIIQTVETLQPECHDVAHDLGRLIYQRYGTVGDALRVCNNACNSACMHGVLMEFFRDDGTVASSTGGVVVTSTVKSVRVEKDPDHVTLEDVQGKILTVCGNKEISSDPTMAASYKQGDCVHGVGHAVMFLANYEIPKAIRFCELFDSPVLRYYCATGAYMEYVTKYHERDVKKYPDRIFYPCDQVRYPAACFRYKMAHLVPIFYAAGNNLAQLNIACLGLKDQYRIGCFHGIGNGHFAQVALKQMTLATVCAIGSRDDQYACTEGLMERLGRYRPEIARSQCDTVTDWQKVLCLEDVKHELYDLTKPFSLYGP